MGLFNHYFSSSQGARRDYEFYIGLCFEVQKRFLEDNIFKDSSYHCAQSNAESLTPSEYCLQSKRSLEKLVLNATILSIALKRAFSHKCLIAELWEKEDPELKSIIVRFASILEKNELFPSLYKEFNGIETSKPLVAGLFYINDRFSRYGDTLDYYFNDDFDINEVDYADEESYKSLEDRKSRLICEVYRDYSQPFCSNPEWDMEIDIDDWEKLVDSFEVLVNNIYNYFIDRLSTGRF